MKFLAFIFKIMRTFLDLPTSEIDELESEARVWEKEQTNPTLVRIIEWQKLWYVKVAVALFWLPARKFIATWQVTMAEDEDEEDEETDADMALLAALKAAKKGGKRTLEITKV